MPGFDQLGGLLEAFLDSSPGCNWIVGGDGMFHRVFGDAQRLFQKTPAELEGREIGCALGAQSQALWSSRFARALNGETLFLRERCGDAVWRVSLFPIRANGEIRYVGGMAGDCARWSLAQQELRRTVLNALQKQEYHSDTLARFLHDSVGQNLSAIGLQLDLLRMDLATVSAASCEQIAKIQQILEAMMQDVRRHIHELNPFAVERFGLQTALNRLTERLRGRYPGSILLNTDPSLKVDPRAASALFQIAREATENAVEHSGCSLVEIAVKSTGAGTVLEVRDNGKGFDPGDDPKTGHGLGLLRMEHYAVQAGLRLSISSDGTAGTTVRAETSEAG
jgi:signal transduction histidine kinase